MFEITPQDYHRIQDRDFLDYTEVPSCSIEYWLSEINKHAPEGDESILQKMTTLCEEKNYDIEEFAEIFATDEFRRILYFDAVKNHEIKDQILKEQLQSTQDVNVW